MAKKTDRAEEVLALKADLEVLSDAVARIEAGGARRKTVIILLAHHSGLSQRVVKTLLGSIEGIVEEYFK